MSSTEASGAHDALLRAFRAGKRTALARVISVVEDERPGFLGLLSSLHAATGRAHRIGVTGPPGAGKSTLTAGLISGYRSADESVAVVAVDPTSPYTGGALLGDRIRMNEVAQDPGVFIRSMATRGSLGGLAVTTKEVADVVDAFGFDRVLIETVGVGQSELDIVAAADTTVVVLVPESGDSVQAMKAGLMEIADIFVVNKADRPGAERLTREIELMIHLRAGQTLRNVPAHHGADLAGVRDRWRKRARDRAARGTGEELGVVDPADGGARAREGARGPEGPSSADAPAAQPADGPSGTDGAGGTDEAGGEWEVPVLQTIAERGDGVDVLRQTIERHRAWLERSGERSRRRRRRLEERVHEAVQRRLLQAAWRDGPGEDLLAQALPALEAGTATPYEVAARIVRAASL